MIIVTGGAGFIGSNIVKALNIRGIEDILIVDNLTNSEKYKNLIPLRFYDFVDKEDFINMLNKFKSYKIDTIFHEGACTNTMEYNGRYMMKNNYEYSKCLLNFAIEKKIRFIYASSASVYGLGDRGFKEIRDCENPMNIYAYSKFLFDEFVRRNLIKLDIQIVGLRYFNVYGPNENHKRKMASIIFQFFNQILEQGKVDLFEGSDNFKRDFVYIEDVVNVNMFFFENPNKVGIFNCGSGVARSFLEAANIMKKFFNKLSINYIPFPDILKGKYQTFTRADLTSLRKIGYKCSFSSLEEGVANYVKFLLKAVENDFFS